MIPADETIIGIFEEYGTNVLNIADYEIDCGYAPVTHVALDGSHLIAYSGNPDLGEDFQDDDYEQLIIDSECCAREITEAVMDLA